MSKKNDKPKAKKKRQVTDADVHEFINAQAVRIDEQDVAILRIHNRLETVLASLESSIARQQARVDNLRLVIARFWNPIKLIQAHARLDDANSHLKKLESLRTRIEKISDASLRGLVSQETGD